MILNNMHKLLKCAGYLLVMMIVPLVSLGNNRADSLFEKGNEQYAKAKYQEAAHSYQEILNEGYQSAAIYYNLGNACYKMGKIPEAILYYEKAHKLAPNDEDINTNIQFANLETTDKIEEAPRFFLSRWVQSFILLLPLRALAVLNVIFLLAGFLLLIVYLFSGSVSMKKMSFYVSVTLICLAIVSILISNQQAHYFASHHQAVIFSGSVTVKSEPADGSKDLFVIHAGAKVNVLEKDNGWIKIGLPNGNEGWISAEAAKEI